MERVLHCDCGFEVHAHDEAKFVAHVRRHALKEHGMQLSPEEVLQLAFRAGLDEAISQQRLGAKTRDGASRPYLGAWNRLGLMEQLGAVRRVETVNG